MSRWQSLSDRERLLLHVAIDDSGCWIWQGSRNEFGYGRFARERKCALAHRRSYELFVGEIPTGMEVCHHCDVPACVHPDHLFLGTHQDNMSDASSKKRFACVKGELNPRSKLTEDDVRFIRNVGGSHSAVASRFGVSHTLVRMIRQRKAWRHVA